MIQLKTREELKLMEAAAQVVSRTLGIMAEEVKPGVNTLQLDKIAEDYIRSQGAIPAFLGLYDFPNTLCVSVNEQVVHGIPNERPLQNGDIVSIDCGAVLEGYYGDHAYTFYVGEVDEEVQKLCERTKKSLYRGIRETKVGKSIGDIGFAIQKYTQKHGYGVVRELVGHGIGKAMHEDPQVPNYGKRGKGAKIEEGLAIAIEPMINLGTHRVRQLKDGWTIVTRDGKPSAHFEHDVAVVDGEPYVLSTFDHVEEALGIEKSTPPNEQEL